MNQNGPTGLERSCRAHPGDWIRAAPAQPGIERIEASFAGHAYDPHRHDTYAIGVTLSGVQSFDYRGARADSTSGNVIVLHPDELHNGRAGTQSGFRYYMMYIEPRLIRHALDERVRSLPFARDVVSANTKLREAALPAFEDLSRPLEALERDQILLGVAESLLTLDKSTKTRSPATTSATAVKKARRYLDEYHASVVSSDELESLTGLDRYTLARHFRATLGTSPYRYLTMRRLDHVRRCLHAGQPLNEAALASGFADQSHMTRQFKRAYGLSPGKWKAFSARASY